MNTKATTGNTEEQYGRPLRRPNAPLFFFACGCAQPRFKRVRRTLWMRVVPFLRLYRCLRCGSDVLRSRVGLRDVYPLY